MRVSGKYRLTEEMVASRFVHKVLVPKKLQLPYSICPAARAFRVPHAYDNLEWRFEYPVRLLRASRENDDSLILLCSDKESIILERFDGPICIEEKEILWQELQRLLQRKKMACKTMIVKYESQQLLNAC